MKTLLTSLILLISINTFSQEKLIDRIEQPVNHLMNNVKAVKVIEKKRFKLPLLQPRYKYICKSVTGVGYKYIIKSWNGKLNVNDIITLTPDHKNNILICKK